MKLKTFIASIPIIGAVLHHISPEAQAGNVSGSDKWMHVKAPSSCHSITFYPTGRKILKHDIDLDWFEFGDPIAFCDSCGYFCKFDFDLCVECLSPTYHGMIVDEGYVRRRTLGRQYDQKCWIHFLEPTHGYTVRSDPVGYLEAAEYRISKLQKDGIKEPLFKDCSVVIGFQNVIQ